MAQPSQPMQRSVPFEIFRYAAILLALALAALAAIAACALCSCGEEDDGEHGKNARGDTRDEPSQQPDGHQTRDGCHDTSPFRSVSCC